MSKAAELANLIGNINAGGGGTNKNLLINGDMSVSQRATSVTGCADSGAYRTVDRWYFNVYSGTFTVSQSSTTPDGFGSSHKFDCTTAETPGAADSTMFYQHMEGQNLQAIKKGTSEAKPLSASFWVRSNLTGTATVELVDNDTSSYRTCSQSYTINSANTWERKTVTFPADTTGPFDNDNASSMYFAFWLVAGSNYTGGTLATSWEGLTNANRAVGQTINIGSSTDNEFYITGVQLEIGQNASPSFEHEPFEVTLRKCQRYYQKTFVYAQKAEQDPATTGGTISGPAYSDAAYKNICQWWFQEVMRSTPTITTYNPYFSNGNWAKSGYDGPTAGLYSSSERVAAIRDNGGGAINTNLQIHADAESEL